MTDNATIEAVARRICTNLGLDPDAKIGAVSDDCCTPLELAEGRSDRGVMMLVPCWQSYRRKAAEALAIQEALVPARNQTH